jgi:hypothetical protein
MIGVLYMKSVTYFFYLLPLFLCLIESARNPKTLLNNQRDSQILKKSLQKDDFSEKDENVPIFNRHFNMSEGLAFRSLGDYEDVFGLPVHMKLILIILKSSFPKFNELFYSFNDLFVEFQRNCMSSTFNCLTFSRL